MDKTFCWHESISRLKRVASIAGILTLSALAPAIAGIEGSDRITIDARLRFNGVKYTITASNRADYLEVLDTRILPRPYEGDETIKGMVNDFIAPSSCVIANIYREKLTKETYYWQAYYTCPTGVDMRKIIANQRRSLLKGEPIQPVANN